MVASSYKRGEKILFGVIGMLGLFAMGSFVMLEIVRAHSDKPLYANLTHFDFSPEGQQGSVLFRVKGCTDCHKALRNGTNMGLDLDGDGSKRSLQFFINFLKDPENTYGARTIDHGPEPKAAAYVAKLPEAQRHAIAVFLSELKATQGSPDAPVPPKGRSDFIDDMVKAWAPKGWKSEFKDVRKEPELETKHEEQNSAASK
jgi:Cytochrome c